MKQTVPIFSMSLANENEDPIEVSALDSVDDRTKAK
jgi:hypothetical protein